VSVVSKEVVSEVLELLYRDSILCKFCFFSTVIFALLYSHCYIRFIVTVSADRRDLSYKSSEIKKDKRDIPYLCVVTLVSILLTFASLKWFLAYTSCYVIV
jgi:hypothetical protein